MKCIALLSRIETSPGFYDLHYFAKARSKLFVGISTLKYAVISRTVSEPIFLTNYDVVIMAVLMCETLLRHLHITESEECVFLMDIDDHKSILFGLAMFVFLYGVQDSANDCLVKFRFFFVSGFCVCDIGDVMELGIHIGFFQCLIYLG